MGKRRSILTLAGVLFQRYVRINPSDSLLCADLIVAHAAHLHGRRCDGTCCRIDTSANADRTALDNR